MSTYKEIAAVETPAATRTYRPVGHTETVAMMHLAAAGLGLEVVDHDYRLARGGMHLLASITMRHPGDDDGLVLACRTSLDKSLCTAAGTGVHIYSSDTLSFSGGIITERRTRHATAGAMGLLTDAADEAVETHRVMLRDFKRMRGSDLDADAAYGYLGRMLGHGILGARQATAAIEAWGSGTRWDLYQMATISLRTAAPDRALQRYNDLHRLLAEDQ